MLDYDGERIQNSGDIAEFLDSKHPEPALYPADAVELASARIWEDWAGAVALLLRSLLSHARPGLARARARSDLRRQAALGARGPEAGFQRRYPRKLKQQGLARQSRKQVELQFFSLLDALEKLLERRKWLAGDRVSIADFSVAAQIDELVRTSDLAPQVLARPRLKEWLARC